MMRPPSSPVEAGPKGFEERCRRLGPALMRDLALTDVQAAGLLGNLGHETGGFRLLQEVDPTVPGSRGGWGIGQWTGPRRLAMERWCRSHGLDPASDAANEGYLLIELRGSEAPALEALRNSATLEQATSTFCRTFERPGIPALADRLVWARRALQAIRVPGGSPASLPEARPLSVRPPSARPPSGRPRRPVGKPLHPARSPR